MNKEWIMKRWCIDNGLWWTDDIKKEIFITPVCLQCISQFSGMLVNRMSCWPIDSLTWGVPCSTMCWFSWLVYLAYDIYNWCHLLTQKPYVDIIRSWINSEKIKTEADRSNISVSSHQKVTQGHTISRILNTGHSMRLIVILPYLLPSQSVSVI